MGLTPKNILVVQKRYRAKFGGSAAM